MVRILNQVQDMCLRTKKLRFAGTHPAKDAYSVYLRNCVIAKFGFLVRNPLWLRCSGVSASEDTCVP